MPRTAARDEFKVSLFATPDQIQPERGTPRAAAEIVVTFTSVLPGRPLRPGTCRAPPGVPFLPLIFTLFRTSSSPMKLIRAWALPMTVLYCLAAGTVLAGGAQPGNVVAWGRYYNGSAFVPVLTPAGLTNAVALAGGAAHSLALLQDGTVTAWGFNSYGQTNVPPGLDNVTAIAAGEYFSLALRGNGTVVAWGQYYNGSVFAPVTVPDGLTNVIAIAAGAGHSLALQGNGNLVAWGDNSYGQTNVPQTLSNVVAVAAGPYSSFALQADGTLVPWGQYYRGGNFVPVSVPVGATNISALAAGAGHILALTAGRVAAWGDDTYGQTNVPSNLTNVMAVAAGGDFSLALRGDTTVVAWGSNVNGQTNVPVNATNVVQIAAGYYHGLALVAEGPVVWSNAVSILALAPGAGAELSVAPASQGVIGTQWFLNGSPIAGATGTSILLTNFNLAQAGAYGVELTNRSGSNTRLIGVLRLTNSPVVEIDGTDVGGGAVARVDATQVTMSSTFGSNAPIYYTLDGSAPDFTAIPYLGPLTITNSGTLRAIAYNSAYSLWAEAAPIELQIWPTYPLDIINPGGGSVASFPFPYTGDDRYLSNSIVTLTATPFDGWSFLGWNNAVATSTNVLTLTLTNPTQVQAIFGTTLNLFTNGSGSIVANPPQGPYAFGSNVKLTALPGPGSFFFGWAGAASGSMDPLFIQATNADGITALFGALKANQISLTVLSSAGGEVSLDHPMNVFTIGDVVTLTANPDTNYLFTGWSGDVTSAENPLTLQLNASAVITANFIFQTPTNPPTIIQQPESTTASAGSDVLLEVQVSGDPPFLYQWRLNGSPLPGATAAELLLSNLSSLDSGLYDVVVNGPGGTVTSSLALVALFGVRTSPSGGGQVPMLILDGPTGSTYDLEFTDNLSAPVWQPLISVLVPSGPFYYIDDPLTNHTQRFYRAIPQ